MTAVDPSNHRSLLEPREWSEADAETYVSCIRSLAPLAPQPLYEVLMALRARELDKARPGWKGAFEARIKAGMRRFPRFTHLASDDQLVSDNALFTATRSVDWAYVTACAAQPGLLQRVVTFRGLERLTEIKRACPVIVAPIHAGPSEVLVGALSRRAGPCSVLVSDPRSRDDRQRKVKKVASQGDLESIKAGSIDVLLQAVRASRGGRTLVIYPETTFSSKAQLAEVNFGGLQIAVPAGLSLLASKLGAATVPAMISSDRLGNYECALGPAFQPDDHLTQRIFSFYETLLLNGASRDWDLWQAAGRQSRSDLLA